MKDNLSLRIRSVISETEDCKTYVFDSPELRYKAGQFLTFILNTGFHEIRRPYSFSSCPKTDKYPSITVKRIENGEGSRYIFNNWKVGDSVTAMSPVGRFIIPESNPKEIILIAAGSGIVPIYSLLKCALMNESIQYIHLFYSNKSKASTIFYNFLLQLESDFRDKLKITWFFSDNIRIIDARINSSFIENYYKKRLTHKTSAIHVFTCGPENFMYLCEVSSKYAEITSSNYHQEIFYREDKEEVSPHQFATGNFEIILKLKAGIYKINVAGNQTILSQAILNKIPLNWSCSTGRCSTCMLRLNSGKVYLHRNEVLTDTEIKHGLTLTCTAYPVIGPIELEEINF